MRSSFFVLLSALMLLGCEPDLPPLEYRSERAWVGSDVVDRVCQGTLDRIDRELVQIERRLERRPNSEPLEIYILAEQDSEQHCSEFENCLQIDSKRVILSNEDFERVVAHELAHYVSALTKGAITSPILFREGFAVALAPAECPTRFAKDLHANHLITLDSGKTLKNKGGYYLGGELFTYLLETHGPAKLMSLLVSLDRHERASSVHRKYRALFGTELNHDLFAHLRDPATLAPEAFGCFGPSAPIDPSNSQVELQAEMDCDAANVQNKFDVPDAGYVEWILAIDEAHAGTYSLVGELPEGTSLTVEPCRCLESPRQERAYLKPSSFTHPRPLKPGSYRLRWTAKLDSGASLDVALVRRNKN